MAAVAATVLLPLNACSTGESVEQPELEKATGKPDQLTTVDPENVPNLNTATKSTDNDISAEVSYPKVPNADPLTERLGELTDQEISDFKSASTDAKSIKIKGNLSVAGDNVVGVRLTQQEKTSDEQRTEYATYWYDTKSGHIAYSTELLAGDKELRTLNGLVKESLKDNDDVDVSTIQPILSLYDSMGFNPDGDLVVEFDEDQVAPAKAGRVHAVIKKKDISPLLSKFGKRARQAATVITPKFTIDKPANSPKGDSSMDDPAVPGLLPPGDGNVDCTKAKSKCIALTFDDGPGARTPELLDALNERDAKATFFLTGEPAREYPRTVRREYAEGHEVGNHTVHHPDLTSMSADDVRDELDPVNALVRRETGYQMELARPPYGSSDKSVSKVTKDEGLAEIMWSVDTNDWRDHDSGTVEKRVLKNAKPGSIVLMHDIHDTTVEAVPSMLKKLQQKGFTMVTVSQMLGDTQPGESYMNGYPEDSDEGKENDDSGE